MTAVHEMEQWCDVAASLIRDTSSLFVSTGEIAFHLNADRGPETVKLEFENLIFLSQNTLDVAILEVTPATAELLNQKAFVQPADLRILNAPKEGLFVAYGHPFFLGDPGDPHEAPQVVKSPVCWFDTTPADSSSRQGHDAVNHLLFRFPPGLVDPRTGKIPDDAIKGMSGCGIWQVQPNGNNGQLANYAKLVGILHRQYLKDGWIVATSLRCVKETLAMEYPDLAEYVNGIELLVL
ncbi:hypothetical protein [Schlesneria paludicola]|uniref:hypothetical protein n=1 Tax=Schlesneria paludicola TaxID=360056 RepID=UPI0012F7C5E3|nr:hypothetical protein [Schlesneria paludicola]